MFNVAIIGGEGTANYEFCEAKSIQCLKNKASSGEAITIFSTGDSFVDAFSTKYHINVRNFYTNWKDYGKIALSVRNNELIKNCNALIAFNDNKKDTRMLYELAVKNGIPVRFFNVKTI